MSPAADPRPAKVSRTRNAAQAGAAEALEQLHRRAAGALLERALEQAGIAREQAYVTRAAC